MIVMRIAGMDEVLANFKDYPNKLRFRIAETMRKIGADFVTYVRTNKLSGSPLHSRTGALKNSIYFSFQESEGEATVTVGTRGVKYAAIQEFGGTVHIPEIRPRSARVLHWVQGGRNVFAMRARAHSVTIPARSYIGSSLREMEPEIVSRLQATVASITR